MSSGVVVVDEAVRDKLLSDVVRNACLEILVVAQAT